MDAYEKDSFKFVWNQKEGSRFLTERFLNNETVTLRHKNLVRKFQTSGMLDKMAEYGITWEEKYSCIEENKKCQIKQR